MNKTQELPSELAESFINGNRTYVRDQILKAGTTLEVIEFIFEVMGELTGEEKKSFQRLMTR